MIEKSGRIVLGKEPLCYTGCSENSYSFTSIKKMLMVRSVIHYGVDIIKHFLNTF